LYIRRNVRRSDEKVSVTYSVVERYRDEDGHVRQRTIASLGEHPTIESRLAELHAELRDARDQGGFLCEMAAIVPTLEIARLSGIATQIATRATADAETPC
jgi:alkylation response protein AidB-like acyl-CoA dehydrogenase